MGLSLVERKSIAGDALSALLERCSMPPSHIRSTSLAGDESADDDRDGSGTEALRCELACEFSLW